MFADEFKQPDNLSGSLLLASPSLGDSNFLHAVILMSVHSVDDGAMGVIINRPKGITLGSIDTQFADSVLSDVPVYEGGPVATDQLILAAWQCSADSSIFKLYFGISEDKAIEMREKDPHVEVRAFQGYTGWSTGQLESELMQNAWIVSAVNPELISECDGSQMWEAFINESNPSPEGKNDDDQAWPGMPDDLSLN